MNQGDSQRSRQLLVRDWLAGVDLGKHPLRALLCRHRGAIDEPITLITLTITLITVREEGVRWDRDAHHNTKLAPVRLGDRPRRRSCSWIWCCVNRGSTTSAFSAL